jgi:hypothetical protein
MNELLDEDVAEAWCYVLETMIFCGYEEAVADADFRWFVGGLASSYPDEFKLVMEVLRDKEYLNGL